MIQHGYEARSSDYTQIAKFIMKLTCKVLVVTIDAQWEGMGM